MGHACDHHVCGRVATAGRPAFVSCYILVGRWGMCEQAGKKARHRTSGRHVCACCSTHMLHAGLSLQGHAHPVILGWSHSHHTFALNTLSSLSFLLTHHHTCRHQRCGALPLCQSPRATGSSHQQSQLRLPCCCSAAASPHSPPAPGVLWVHSFTAYGGDSGVGCRLFR